MGFCLFSLYLGALALSLGMGAVGAGLDIGGGGDEGGADKGGGSLPPMPPLFAASLQPVSTSAAADNTSSPAALISHALALECCGVSRKSRG